MHLGTAHATVSPSPHRSSHVSGDVPLVDGAEIGSRTTHPSHYDGTPQADLQQDDVGKHPRPRRSPKKSGNRGLGQSSPHQAYGQMPFVYLPAGPCVFAPGGLMAPPMYTSDMYGQPQFLVPVHGAYPGQMMPMPEHYVMPYGGGYHPVATQPTMKHPTDSPSVSGCRTIDDCDAALLKLVAQRKQFTGVVNKRRRQKINTKVARITEIREQLLLDRGHVSPVRADSTPLSAAASPFVPVGNHTPSPEVNHTSSLEDNPATESPPIDEESLPAWNQLIASLEAAVLQSGTAKNAAHAGKEAAPAVPRRAGTVSRARTRKTAPAGDKENETRIKKSRRPLNLPSQTASGQGKDPQLIGKSGRGDLLSPIVNNVSRAIPR